jgi:probable addiction module antidote protein
MNSNTVLKHTTSFKENLLKALKAPDEAQAYLEAALLAYEEDGNTEALLLAMRDVTIAQGGIGKLAKRVGVAREHLYSVLSSKHNPRLDKMLSILSGLGFRVRLEKMEPQPSRLKKSRLPRSRK